MPSCRPTNFTWVIEGLLSGCAFPSHGGHFRFFTEEGIRHLVTLTEYTPPLHILPPELKFHHIPIPEFDAPTVQQMRELHHIVLQAQQKNEGVAVHCYWGRGRTGTMLAACLVGLFGTKPTDAIKEIRQKRPYSIETFEQERAVHQFALSLNSNTDKPKTDEDVE